MIACSIWGTQQGACRAFPQGRLCLKAPSLLPTLHGDSMATLSYCAKPIVPVSEHMGSKTDVKIAVKSNDKTSEHLLRA